MATIYRCDGCDKEFKNRGEMVGLTISYEHSRLSTDENRTQLVDLCPRCVGTFNRNLKSLLEDRVAAA